MKKAIANSPLDRGLLKEPQTEALKPKAKRGRFTTEVEPVTIQQLRRAAVELQMPLAHIVNEALTLWLAKAEKKSGKDFSKPIDRLKGGRPIRIDSL